MARPRQVSDEQIDEAARATFLRHGPHAPVALVAGKLGVSHAALLQRAGSKEKLLLRALGPRPPAAIEALAEPPPSERKAERLVELLRELLVFHEQLLPGIVVLRSGGLPTWPRGAEPPTLLVRRLLTSWLGRAATLERRRAAAVAEGLLGALEARCFNAYLGGAAFVEGEPRRFVQELVAGLVPELTPRRRRGSR